MKLNKNTKLDIVGKWIMNNLGLFISVIYALFLISIPEAYKSMVILYSNTNYMI